MIRERLLALRERRALLVIDADAQRTSVAAVARKLEKAAGWYDRAKDIALKMRAHPVWVAAGVALFVAARPRKALKLVATGFSLWRGWRRLSATLDRFAPVRPAARRA
jgi:hypothetical protein